jgi:hypothetical protein
VSAIAPSLPAASVVCVFRPESRLEQEGASHIGEKHICHLPGSSRASMSVSALFAFAAVGAFLPLAAGRLRRVPAGKSGKSGRSGRSGQKVS